MGRRGTRGNWRRRRRGRGIVKSVMCVYVCVRACECMCVNACLCGKVSTVQQKSHSGGWTIPASPI